MGAHHHNGHAERSIGTIMSITRAMLIHQALHWPALSDPQLWPMCVVHAVYLWNHVPDASTGLSPNDLFTRSRWKLSRFHDLQVFGCPAYVLSKTIADGKKIPKWKPRSTRCVYLGISREHASCVPLVLNPATGFITPQFHVVCDDWFHTVSSTVEDLPDFNSDAWKKLFGDSIFQYYFEDDDLQQLVEAQQDLASSRDDTTAAHARERICTAFHDLRPSDPLPGSSVTSAPLPPRPVGEISTQVSPSVPVTQSVTSSPGPKNMLPSITKPSSSVKVPATVMPSMNSKDVTSSVPSISPPTSTVSPSMNPNDAKASIPPLSMPTSTVPQSEPRRANRLYSQSEVVPPLRRSKRLQAKRESLAPGIHYAFLFAAIGVSLLAASSSDPDTYTNDEAMASEYKEEFIKAAQIEIQELEKHETWLEEAMSRCTDKVIPSTWVFKIKRRPDGSIKKV